MEALEALTRRTSLRKYAQEPVPKHLLEQVVDAGRHAPTARNEQPWEFVVVTDQKKLQQLGELADYGGFIAKAPACIVVFCTDTKYYLEDGCAAVENMLIAATALGLGTCWVAGDKKPYAESVRELVDAPKHLKLIALVPIGNPVGEMIPRDRRPLGDVLHWETFKV